MKATFSFLGETVVSAVTGKTQQELGSSREFCLSLPRLKLTSYIPLRGQGDLVRWQEDCRIHNKDEFRFVVVYHCFCPIKTNFSWSVENGCLRRRDHIRYAATCIYLPSTSCFQKSLVLCKSYTGKHRPTFWKEHFQIMQGYKIDYKRYEPSLYYT
jgi:hypothetical protein